MALLRRGYAIALSKAGARSTLAARNAIGASTDMKVVKFVELDEPAARLGSRLRLP
jgi:hypothetical protein